MVAAGVEGANQGAVNKRPLKPNRDTMTNREAKTSYLFSGLKRKHQEQSSHEVV